MKMKAPEPRFISAEDGQPVYATITAIEPDEKGGFMLYLDTKEGPRRASLWGENLHKGIKAYGDDSAAWIGKTCSCMFIESPTDGKKYRVFTFP